jgi:hypothetical protein
VSFVSDVSNTFVINDENAIAVAQKSMATGYIERDWKNEPFGASGVAVPLTIPLIPRHEWPDRIEAIEKGGALLSQMALRAGVKTKFQSSTNYCWAHGPTLATEICEVKQGAKYVELCATSVAAPLTGYRNVGGWGTKALAKIVADGIAPVSTWPTNSIDPRHDNAQSRAARAAHKITEWADVEPRNFDALMTCLLLGAPVPVAYMWWSHLVCAVDPVSLGGGRFGVRIWNSHGINFGDKGFAVLTESKGTPDEACCPMVALVA